MNILRIHHGGNQSKIKLKILIEILFKTRIFLANQQAFFVQFDADKMQKPADDHACHYRVNEKLAFYI